MERACFTSKATMFFRINRYEMIASLLRIQAEFWTQPVNQGAVFCGGNRDGRWTAEQLIAGIVTMQFDGLGEDADDEDRGYTQNKGSPHHAKTLPHHLGLSNGV
jgi:hypothetical protein